MEYRIRPESVCSDCLLERIRSWGYEPACYRDERIKSLMQIIAEQADILTAANVERMAFRIGKHICS
jgi:hypothetical protein